MNAIKRYLFGISIMSLSLLNFQCKKNTSTNQTSDKVSIEKSAYGTLPNGQKVESYTLKNQKGMEVSIITYGGIITSLKVPNKEGKSEEDEQEEELDELSKLEQVDWRKDLLGE